MTRVFFDMDGVLAEYKYVPLDDMMQQGYFRDLAPQEEAVAAIKKLAEDPSLAAYPALRKTLDEMTDIKNSSKGA